jgi:hypothetical protein
METLNSRNPIDLWESEDNHKKLHISYNVCLDPSTLSIYRTQGPEECIIVSVQIIFLSYQEWAFFSPIPLLQNFGLTIGKNCF